MKNEPTYLYAGENAKEAIAWFKNLDVNTRIQIKELTLDVLNVSWVQFNALLFTPRQRLGILFDKLYMVVNDIEYTGSFNPLV